MVRFIGKIQQMVVQARLRLVQHVRLQLMALITSDAKIAVVGVRYLAVPQ